VNTCTATPTTNVNYVIIDHSDGTATQYLHLRNIGNDNASSMRYDGVWLFEHLNYNADANYVARAEFFRGNDDYLPNNYVFNDNVTSLTVSHGWQITLYQHAWYSGNQLTLGVGTYPDLRQFWCGCGGDGTWNDQASSVQVYRVGP
jgi:hypothetical protein